MYIRLFSIIRYYKILYVILYAVQQLLLVHLSYVVVGVC